MGRSGAYLKLDSIIIVILKVQFSHEVQVQNEVVLFQRSSTCSVLDSNYHLCHHINAQNSTLQGIFNGYLLDVWCFSSSVNFGCATGRMAG